MSRPSSRTPARRTCAGPAGPACARSAWTPSASTKVERVGISNAGRRQLAEAQTVVDIVAVENQLSPRSLGALPVLQQCEAQDIAVLSWSPLGGSARAADLGQELPEFAAVARERAVSPHQVALAWALHLSPVVLPLPAARRPETILDSVAAAQIQLTDDERSRLRAALTTSSEGRRSGASGRWTAGQCRPGAVRSRSPTREPTRDSCRIPTRGRRAVSRYLLGCGSWGQLTCGLTPR
jgi:hypothetical protein